MVSHNIVYTVLQTAAILLSWCHTTLFILFCRLLQFSCHGVTQHCLYCSADCCDSPVMVSHTMVSHSIVYSILQTPYEPPQFATASSRIFILAVLGVNLTHQQLFLKTWCQSKPLFEIKLTKTTTIILTANFFKLNSIMSDNRVVNIGLKRTNRFNAIFVVLYYAC